MNPKVKNPWRQVILFSIFPIVFFGVPFLAMWGGGELTSPETVINRQATEKTLVLHGAALTNTIIYEKTRLMNRLKPEVLALGTSRVLQFRDTFFLPDVSFYNGGSVIQRLPHLRQCLDLIPQSSQPKVLIVGVEQAWFNGNSAYTEMKDQGKEWFDEQEKTAPDPLQTWRTNWWNVWTQLVNGRLPIGPLFSGRGLTDRIGFTADVYGAGYRNDGSYQYRDYYFDIADPRHPDRNFSRGLKRIAQNTIPFEAGADVYAPSVEEMGKFLDECKARGIYVVGFLPPLPNIIARKLDEEGERFAYLKKLVPALDPLFTGRGFEFYDYSDFAMLGAQDSEAVDSFHGSERVYVRLALSLIQKGSRLAKFLDKTRLEEAIKAGGNTDLIPPR